MEFLPIFLFSAKRLFLKVNSGAFSLSLKSVLSRCLVSAQFFFIKDNAAVRLPA